LASLSVAGRPATRGAGAAGAWRGDLAPAAPERSRLLSQALLPAASVGDWEALRAMDGACLSRVVRVDCRTSREEAGVIALALRETLAVPDQTAALVTPDRTLARRVAVALARWDIQVDDSAGVPLAQTVPGVFVSLLATAMSEDMAPAPLLAVLKHPLAAGGETPVVFREAVRHMERCVLRGPRPAPGLGGVVASLRRLARQATAWRRTRDHDTPRAARDVDPAEMQALAGRMQHLKAAADPFARLLRRRRVMLADLLDAHLALAEALAATDSANGAARLWHGEAGQALAAFLADLRGRSAVLGPVSGAHYSHLLAALLAGQAVRLAGRSHPRLAILGLLEARLARYDRMILGGLNEGTWPGEPAADPWMSRPMRQSFGLPAAERRIGLAAHDFTQAFAAPDVILTRAERVDGQPTVPSRWLTRLDAALQGGGMADGLTKDASVWRDWVRQLDDPALAVPALAAGESRPAPTPPVAARPRRLSVTAVETWRDNPYAVYARYVLRLRPLDPLDGEPGAADRGIIIHRVLDRFMARVSETGWPGDPVSMLLAMGEDAFADLMDRPSVRAFWWPRFRRVANWFALEEGARRSSLSQTWSEAEGRLVLAGPAGDFTLTARADRIDRLSDGTLTIIDYKTGSAPSTKKVAALVAPQLPLEATIAEAGGFAGDGGRGPAAGPVSTLAYWKLTGGAMPGRVQTIDAVQHDLAARARLMLSRRIALYDRVEQPYTARQSRTPAAMDYDHLARRKAWLLAQDLGDGRDGTDNGENEGGS
ncbi:MAG: double-strand break repair protein AddB, partial [Alphaproteobacteria bacterium]